MYRQSFFLVLLTLLFVGLLSAGSGQFMAAIPGWGGLPSSYDPKRTVEESAQSSSTPLLIEFYTDSCRTCQLVTPWVHRLSKKYKNELTFVMVDVNNPQNSGVANIFGIEYVPAIFVFDFKHMAKAQVDIASYKSEEALDKGIQKAQAKVAKQAQSKIKAAQ